MDEDVLDAEVGRKVREGDDEPGHNRARGEIACHVDHTSCVHTEYVAGDEEQSGAAETGATTIDQRGVEDPEPSNRYLREFSDRIPAHTASVDVHDHDSVTTS